MLSAKDSNGNVVYSFEIKKEDGPFFCPLCGEKLVFKHGPIKIAHFAHKPNTSCYFGRGESIEHMKAKHYLYTWLESQGIKAKIEEPIGNGIVDILFYPPRYPKGVCIELQHSFISINEIIDRLKNSTFHNLPSLWINLDSNLIISYHYDTGRYHIENKYYDDIDDEIIKLSMQERFLSTLYFNVGFYYQSNKIFKLTFKKVGEYTGEYYDPDTEEEKTYYYTPKTLRIVKDIRTVNIINDFKPFYRKAFETKRYTVPDCLLWFPR